MGLWKYFWKARGEKNNMARKIDEKNRRNAHGYKGVH